MPVELTDRETELLRRVVESRLSDYSQQIASADEHAFREQLREERDSLQHIAERLRAA